MTSEVTMNQSARQKQIDPGIRDKEMTNMVVYYVQLLVLPPRA